MRSLRSFAFVSRVQRGILSLLYFSDEIEEATKDKECEKQFDLKAEFFCFMAEEDHPQDKSNHASKQNGRDQLSLWDPPPPFFCALFVDAHLGEGD